jgi:predicted transposase YdaD
MRRDSIFYQLFRQSPSLLFELVPELPVRANEYIFAAVEVKETAFRLDGVFLPPELPIGLGLMVLTTLEGEKATTAARVLIARSQGSKDIIDLISTIIVYKFSSLSRDEVDVMLGIELEQTRVYRDAKAEGKAEGELIGHEAGLIEGEIKEAQGLILRLLTRRVGNVPADIQARIRAIPLIQLEELGEALLDFTQMGDLIGWLDEHHG